MRTFKQVYKKRINAYVFFIYKYQVHKFYVRTEIKRMYKFFKGIRHKKQYGNRKVKV